ncbi:MAG: sulfotransferase domain-containing protein [Pseudomonadota bacterium]
MASKDAVKQTAITKTGFSHPNESVFDDFPGVREALNEPNSVLLVSTMKSGTHWMRYLFANYIKILSTPNPANIGPVKYEGLQGRYSPTDRRAAMRDPSHFNRSKGFPFHSISNLMWQHVNEDLFEYQGKIVFIYRNPLDYLISRYHYDKELWASEGRDVSSPEATIDWSIRWYAQNLSLMREIQRQNDVVSVTYEDLKLNTFVAMSIVLRFLGIPTNMKKLRRAIRFSSAEKVKKEEDERGRPIVGSTTEGRFVRDASVGQWKGKISDGGIDRVDGILREHGFNLRQFVTEPNFY